jgi:hypothetical protein
MTAEVPNARTLCARIVAGALLLLFASPLSLALGVFALDLLVRVRGDFADGGADLLVIFLVPALAGLAAARLARFRLGLAVLPAVALASVFGWGLAVLSSAHFD